MDRLRALSDSIESILGLYIRNVIEGVKSVSSSREDGKEYFNLRKFIINCVPLFARYPWYLAGAKTMEGG